MENNHNQLKMIKVGMFVVIALAVGMFVIFMIGSDKKIFEKHYTLKCTFADISGLRIGAPVQLAGVSVGFVDDIRFPKDLLQKEIEVTLIISAKFQDRIRADSIATINTQGLLGDKFIFLSVGSADEPELKNGDRLETKEIVGLFALAAKGGDIMDSLEGAIKNISKVFGEISEGREDVKATLKSIRNIMKKAETGQGLIHALVYDPKGTALINDLAGSMRSLRILLGQADTGGSNKGKINSLMANLNKTALNLSKITDTIESGQGTIGGLINDPSIYNDIRSIFGKANRNALFKAVVRSTLEENDKEVLK